jgi:hypothetical protein
MVRRKCSRPKRTNVPLLSSKRRMFIERAACDERAVKGER